MHTMTAWLHEQLVKGQDFDVPPRIEGLLVHVRAASWEVGYHVHLYPCN